MKLSAILEPLIAAGVSGDAILAVVKAYEEEAERNDPLEKRRAADRERFKRYKERRNLSASDWTEISGEVFRRDGFVCRYCGDEEGPHEVDHITPLSRGGTNDLDNLGVACKRCNGGKSGRTVQEWRGAK